MKGQLTINIGWLYPKLMSTYGDQGNILVIRKRCEWRDIGVKIIHIGTETDPSEINKLDMIFGGGAQDHEQQIVMNDLNGKKGDVLKKSIENNLPALFVCGSPQLMGNFYEPSEGKQIKGLGIFNIESVHPGLNQKRLIGNIAAKLNSDLMYSHENNLNSVIVGFENHGGRTYLKKGAKPFAYILKGYGNNAEDKTEGVVYKNAIGTYLHGPLLPKNPFIADLMIKKALEFKCGRSIKLDPLNDELENKAKNFILKKMGIEVLHEK